MDARRMLESYYDQDMPLIIWCLSLFLVTAPQAQATNQPPSRDKILSASHQIVANARYATLVTVNGASQPDARIIDPFAPEYDWTIWFATNAASRKVGELKADSRVTLLYFYAPTKGYVTIKGRATLVSDSTEKSKRWKTDWSGMYKKDNQGDDYLLVKVTPESLEVVSVALGMLNDSVTWKPVTITIK
jgi:general stress protein 26